MQITETARLLEMVASVDYREVNPLVVKAWHDIIGGLDFQLAIDALASARRDESIYGLVDPRDVLRHSKIVTREREREQRRQTGSVQPVYTKAPQPKNWQALIAAWDDPVEWAKQVAIYEQQLRDEGYEDEWTRTGRVDFHTRSFPGYS